MNVEKTREAATKFMIDLANDPSHGYDQEYRWGEHGDYDCSSAVISAYEHAGVPVKSNGATYTGNMKEAFLLSGFKDVSSEVNLYTGEGLIEGDVLLNEIHHTAMYCGDGREVEASINELGTATGGQPGDQTGREFLIRPYYNYKWDCVLRYMGNYKSTKPQIKLTVEEVQFGDRGKSVWTARALLRGRGYKTKDGKLLRRSKVFDKDTEYCVKCFQKKHDLDADGIIGQYTWSKLIGQ